MLILWKQVINVLLQMCEHSCLHHNNAIIAHVCLHNNNAIVPYSFICFQIDNSRKFQIYKRHIFSSKV